MLDSMTSQGALLFTIPAVVGTLVFLVKMGLMTLGGLDLDVDVDADVDADLGDSTDAFNLLSIQSMAALLMGFGWGGLGGFIGLGWELPGSLAIGAICGAGMVYLLGLMFKAIYDLQSSGNVDARKAVGCEGTVYANVPAAGEGRGQVRVIIGENARIYNAVSDSEAFPTNAKVRVVRVDSARTLTVSAAS